MSISSAIDRLRLRHHRPPRGLPCQEGASRPGRPGAGLRSACTRFALHLRATHSIGALSLRLSNAEQMPASTDEDFVVHNGRRGVDAFAQ